MKTMSKGRARTSSQSRTFRRGTKLAGKSLFLPNESVPVVVQTLTRSQIAAIPKERFSVVEFGAESRGRIISAMKLASTMSKGCVLGVVTSGDSAIGSQYAAIQSAGNRNVEQICLPTTTCNNRVRLAARQTHHMGLRYKMHGFGLRHKILSTPKRRKKDVQPMTNGKSLEERILTITEIIGKLQKEVESLTIEVKNSNHSNGDNPPPGSNIFKPGIDETRMSECIFSAREAIMGDKKSCSICGLTVKLVDFCILTHLTLERMGFLANTAQKPFCEYLKTAVFGEEAPIPRTFNEHYHKKPYKDYGKELEQMDFNPAVRPPEKYKNDFCYMACHKIAEIFHKTDYFEILRSQKKSFEPLVL